jgi:hypothetical protein
MLLTIDALSQVKLFLVSSQPDCCGSSEAVVANCTPSAKLAPL